MVGGKSSSSSESEAEFATMGNKELLEFYQNKFDELQKKDDKYREKVDKHLKELIADRHELEGEVYRKGEKISDLQKALIDLQLSCFEERERFLNVSAENDRLKKNEVLLHKNIRQLLNYTKDKELQDKIIYILHDPKVEIGFRYAEGKSAGSSTSTLTKKKSADDFLREQVQELQSKIDEFSKISKSSSDVILEDCKHALQKSRQKILEDEGEIRMLQRKLQESEASLCDLRRGSPEFQDEVTNTKSQASSLHSIHRRFESKSAESLARTKNMSILPSSKSEEIVCGSQTSQNIDSHLKDLSFSLASLSRLSSKISSLIKNIQSSEVFVLAAKQSAQRISTSNIKDSVKRNLETVEEADIVQLENLVRQCSRLSFDINSGFRSLEQILCKTGIPVTPVEIEQLQTAINDLVACISEADLLSMTLSRAKFFDYLKQPVETVTRFQVEDVSKLLRNVSDFMNMEGYIKSASIAVSSVTKMVEKVHQKVEFFEIRPSQSKTSSSKFLDKSHSQTKQFCSKNQPIKVNTIYETEKNRLQDKINERNKNDTTLRHQIRRTRSEPIGGDDVTRYIDKTLAKIRQIENGEYVKDAEFCRHLAEQISALSEKLRLLYEEFNLKSFQDHFHEYSSVTLSKLEALAKQSRDTVLSAEAQISAYRSNAKVLSQKLKDTEELLRESINECLGLKQKLKKEEMLREVDKAKSTEKMQRASSLEDLNTAVKEVSASKKSSTGPRRPEGPYECMFCKQGSDHKLCEEKIRELRANVRKLSTELKILNQELKEEKKKAKLSQEHAEKIVVDSVTQKESVKDTLQSLETRNASLLEQLKMVKNRLKNMERYRRSEIEGFQTDIKNLKQKISDLEKQLTKAVLIYDHDQKNMELLKTVHATAQRSKAAVGALKRLKAKLYEIETDIKHI